MIYMEDPTPETPAEPTPAEELDLPDEETPA
jgi:hypothetical protein